MHNSAINVTRSSLPDFQEYMEEIRSIWDTHWLTNMGEKHVKLEASLCEYLDVPYCTLFTNGHLALETAIAAMGLTGEVVTTPFTFASTTHAIVRNGLKPVFCDINEIDYTIDTEKLEALITERTSAIVPVHVYGNVCRVEEIQRIADKYHLKVIYDAAHAFGVTSGGESVARFGDVSMFSFHATKVFHTIEGGAVTCANPDLRVRLNDLKNFGIHGQEEVVLAGGNAKMNEFQAAMGLCNLRHLDEEMEKRGVLVGRYRERLEGIGGIRLAPIQSGVRTNYAYFPVIFEQYKYSRDEVYEKLKDDNIIARKYFFPLTNSFSCYRGQAGFDPESTPTAKHIADRVLTLPLYAELSLSDIDRICEVILR